MTWGSLKTGEALIEMAVDVDVSEFPALETGCVIMEVIVGEGYVVVTAGPPDFSVGDSSLLFLS